MYVDNSLLVSGRMVGNTISGQDVIGQNTIINSSNTIDLGTKRDIGAGEPIQLYAHVINPVVGATSIEIQAITNVAPVLDADSTVLASTGKVVLANLRAGARFLLGLSPVIGSLGKRYLGARYIVEGNATAGSFITGFGISVQDGLKFYQAV